MTGRILFAVRVVAFANFVLLALGAWWLGGDAVNGKVANGRYFLGLAGDLTEVSRGVWIYSYVHVISNFVTAGLAVVALTIEAVRDLSSVSSIDADTKTRE
jgi:hypothetical protein